MKEIISWLPDGKVRPELKFQCHGDDNFPMSHRLPVILVPHFQAQNFPGKGGPYFFLKAPPWVLGLGQTISARQNIQYLYLFAGSYAFFKP